MSEKLEREQLIFLVEQFRQGMITEEQDSERLDAIDRSVLAPAGYVCDLIFWLDGDKALTSAEIVDKALAYKAICL